MSRSFFVQFRAVRTFVRVLALAIFFTSARMYLKKDLIKGGMKYEEICSNNQ